MVSLDAERHADELFATLRGLPTKTGYRLHCPAHDDQHPSLDVRVKDERLLLICRAGCSQDAVIGALKERGLWEGIPSPPTPSPTTAGRCTQVRGCRLGVAGKRGGRDMYADERYAASE